MIKREFHCPTCQSRYFGGLPDRTCSGSIFVAIMDGSGKWKAERCTFTWNVKDDWKYMQTVVTAEDETDDVHSVVVKAILEHQRTRTLPDDEGPPPEGTLAPI